MAHRCLDQTKRIGRLRNLWLLMVPVLVQYANVQHVSAQQSTLTVAQFEELLTRNTWTGTFGALSSFTFSFTSDRIYVLRTEGFGASEIYGVWEVQQRGGLLFLNLRSCATNGNLIMEAYTKHNIYLDVSLSTANDFIAVTVTSLLDGQCDRCLRSAGTWIGSAEQVLTFGPTYKACKAVCKALNLSTLVGPAQAACQQCILNSGVSNTTQLYAVSGRDRVEWPTSCNPGSAGSLCESALGAVLISGGVPGFPLQCHQGSIAGQPGPCSVDLRRFDSVTMTFTGTFTAGLKVTPTTQYKLPEALAKNPACFASAGPRPAPTSPQPIGKASPPPPASAQTNFTNLLAALQSPQLSNFTALIRSAGLESFMGDPNLNITLFAPSNEGVSVATRFFTANGINITQYAPLLLQYHMVPTTSITLPVRRDQGDQILPTLLEGQNITNTTHTLTLRRYGVVRGNETWYLGGVASGAYFNASSRLQAGRSQVYLLEQRGAAILIPPSSFFQIPLSIWELLRSAPRLSILSSLIDRDSVLAKAIADPNLVVTMFAPTDAAFSALFRVNNMTLEDIAGTATARRILLNHICAPPAEFCTVPLSEDDLYELSTISNVSLLPFTLTSASNDTIALSNFNPDLVRGGNTTVAVRGAGNSGRIPLLETGKIAGMSIVHVVDSVILPKFNATTSG